MAWKKKEKPLTPEEAIALAKKELTPFWFNSEPLLAAVRTEQGASVLPLNSNFVQHPWLYTFIDPTEFVGEQALFVVREWYKRYSIHKMGFIVVFRAPTPFANSASDYLRKFQIQAPAMLDQENLFATAFGVRSWPAAVIQSGTNEIVRGSGSTWLEGTEEKLQFFLRKTDPGLSLSLPYEVESPMTENSRVDFGTFKGKPVSSLGQFIQLEGNWKETGECLSTSDPQAVAHVRAPSGTFAVVAQAAIESQITKILTRTEDGAMMQEWAPEEITIDENGNGVVRVQHFGLYTLLKDLPPSRRKISLTFPDADTVPINLYGLRFGSKN